MSGGEGGEVVEFSKRGLRCLDGVRRWGRVRGVE